MARLGQSVVEKIEVTPRSESEKEGDADSMQSSLPASCKLPHERRYRPSFWE